MKQKKEVVKKTKATKSTERRKEDTKMKELEDLVVLIDKKIIDLEKKMNSMDIIYNRIKTRMGV